MQDLLSLLDKQISSHSDRNPREELCDSIIFKGILDMLAWMKKRMDM